MKNSILILLMLFVFIGCATSYKMNNIGLGMTKNEVINIIGQPTSTSAHKGVEYMSYQFYETGNDAFYGWGTPFYVRIIDGKVDAYGRRGDFDSTKVPESKSTIDLNITNKQHMK